MRREFNSLGLPRPEGAGRLQVRAALVGGVGLFLVLLGTSLFAGTAATDQPIPVWIVIVLIAVGVSCWVVEGLLKAQARRATTRLDSRSAIGTATLRDGVAGQAPRLRPSQQPGVKPPNCAHGCAQ
ncbi:hypothetical protein [Curtobacterium sp. MCPF17_047]|uniref:hypothetical protein n=1 Tax=Curtobacterium sp. MCPF17_047 TaxID=2175654 RepID=UPI001C646AA0|nr:hypothetical protein [Curtobacterium sp. MCPF17_047]